MALNLKKLGNFFSPLQVAGQVHIIGCGAIGSWIAMQLVRQGLRDIELWDFDEIDSHNLTNQHYPRTHIGQPKVVSLRTQMRSVNPEARVIIHKEPYINQPLAGYVFLCVDSIDLRREITEQHLNNPLILGMFDCRMGLTSAQHYAADWKSTKQKERFLASMQFSDDEVEITSACGTQLSVLPTVLNITQVAVSNFMNHTKGLDLKNEVHIDSFIFTTNYY